MAHYLNSHPQVSKVIHPNLHDNDEDRNRTKKYLKKGSGPLVGFELKGGKNAGQQFIDNLKLIYHVANIGDARTLAIHPATTTHSQLSEEDQFCLLYTSPSPRD